MRILAAATVRSGFAGTGIAYRISQDTLKRAFALFAAIYVLLEAVIGG